MSASMMSVPVLLSANLAALRRLARWLGVRRDACARAQHFTLACLVLDALREREARR